jgi:hypothetical protein
LAATQNNDYVNEKKKSFLLLNQRKAKLFKARTLLLPTREDLLPSFSPAPLYSKFQRCFFQSTLLQTLGGVKGQLPIYTFTYHHKTPTIHSPFSGTCVRPLNMFHFSVVEYKFWLEKKKKRKSPRDITINTHTEEEKKFYLH